MEQIKEQLDRISELSDEELSGLESQALSEFQKLEGEDVTPAAVDAMNELADSLDAVRNELSKRATAAAELAQRAEDVKARVNGGSDAPDESVAEPDAAPEGAEAASGGGNAGGLDDATSDPMDPNAAGTDAVDPSQPHDFVDDNNDGQCDICGNAADDPIHTVTAAVAVAEAPSAPAVEAAAEEAPAEPVADAAPAEDAAAAEAQPPVEAATEEPAEGEAPADDAAAAETDEGTEAAPAEEAGADDAVSEAPAEETAADEGEAPAEAATETGEEESEEQPVTASATPEASEPVVTAPADRQPVPRATASVAITAGADIPGVSAGSALPDMNAVAEAMMQRMHQMRRTQGGDGEQHTVASLVASFPEDRILKSGDLEGNAQKIEAITSPEAITAAGGICAPVQVQYDLFGLGELGRPVKDALATFTADRGGIRFVTPPTIADLDGAVSLWTLQDDIDAATAGAPDPVKPCLRVACGEEVTVYTDAIPLCLTFGNMGARAYPELVSRQNELAMINQARFAETRLLTRIGTLSTAVTTTKKIGATADFLASVDRATTAYRNRHRMDRKTTLRVMAPQWLLDLMRADLAYRMPGDGLEASFAIAEATINSFFASRNVNITWFMDGETGQVFGAQTAGSLLDFPGTVIWYIFSEGTFLFLDGGTLDLGLVRDSSLNSTNDYKMFVETFEGVAKVGIESLRVTSTLEPSGMVAGTVDLSAGVAA